MLFQSTRSSSCAVCAIGNLASLYGLTYTREEIYRSIEALGTSRRSLVNHRTLLAVAKKLIPSGPLAWRRQKRISYDALRRNLRQILNTGAPALLTFHMRHTEKTWGGVHCVVVIAIDDLGIHVIDSLGCRCGCKPSAIISSKETSFGWKMKGAPMIVTAGPTRVLQGLPPY